MALPDRELVITPGLSVTAMSAAVSLSYRFLARFLEPAYSLSMANGVATLAAILLGFSFTGLPFCLPAA